MASKTEIANMSISHLGIGREIANIDTEQTEEASACRRFFEIAKESTLSDLDWGFATKEAVLNLISESPTDEWAFSYRYPIDCLNIRRLISGVRNDTSASRLPFKIVRDAGGRVIYTDQEGAELEYTENIVDPSFFTAIFSLALSFRLASFIAPRLTGGDPFKMKQEMLAQYQLELGQAKKQNMNEETRDKKADSEFITTRS